MDSCLKLLRKILEKNAFKQNLQKNFRLLSKMTTSKLYSSYCFAK